MSPPSQTLTQREQEELVKKKIKQIIVELTQQQNQPRQETSCHTFIIKDQQNLLEAMLYLEENSQISNSNFYPLSPTGFQNSPHQNTQSFVDIIDSQQKQTEVNSDRQYLKERIHKKKKLRNIKSIKSDKAIIVLKYLEKFLESTSPPYDQIQDCIEAIQKKIDEDKQINYSYDKEFKSFFSKRKFYSEESCKIEIFQTNIFNVIARQLKLKKKTNCINKLQKCYNQLSKNWINLLDLQKNKYKVYLDLLKKANSDGILKNIYTNQKYNKFHFLQIALDLLKNLKEYKQYSENSDIILRLLRGIVKMKLDKYTQKKAINFTKQNIIDLIYCDRQFDEEAKKEVEEVSKESLIYKIEQVSEESLIYRQGKKKKKLNI